MILKSKKNISSIKVITLFPKLYEPFVENGPIRKAIENSVLEFKTIYLKDFGIGKQKQVDDTPYGGGAGMLLMIEPIDNAIKKIKTKKSKVILITPDGEKYDQGIAKKLSKEDDLIFISGYYEGFDHRIKNIIDMEISIGDYIVSRGDFPILNIVDSLVRLKDNVINKDSIVEESFNNNLLEYPQYTKPRNYKKMKVPDVLVSGNHKNIDEFRLNESIKKTKNKRKDLYYKYKEQNNGSK